MFSPRDSHTVMDELGDKLLLGLVTATTLARDDLRELRQHRPTWMPRMFERDSANLIHSRIWAHLEDELDGVDGVTLVSREPNREIIRHTPLGRTYRARLKRHSRRDRIRSYSTISDVRFWSGGEQTFEDLESINLAVGYRWDADAHEIGATVVSYREGKGHVVWAEEITAAADGFGASPIKRTPIEPTLPAIDLRRAAEAGEEGSEAK